LLILRLTLRAIRSRAAVSATVFVVAVIGILAAAAGPIYLPAVDQTVFANHLKDAGPFQRDVLISRVNDQDFRGVDWDAQVQRLARLVARDHLFARPVSEQQVSVVYGGREPLKSQLAYIQGLCGHVRIISGRCLRGNATNETLISANTAAAEHLTVGGTLEALTTTGTAIPLRVVGVFRPVAPNGPFWGPWDLLQFGQPASPTSPAAPGDASFVSSSALSSRLPLVLETFSANLALRPLHVGYGDLGELRSTLARVDGSVAHLSSEPNQILTVATVTTGLPAVLSGVAKETSLARTLVTVATAQLALLAIFLLYAVVANTTAAQESEVALAKLRGRRTGSVVLQAVAQPVLLILAAAPVGALLAWILVRLLAGRLLGYPVDVVFPPAAYGIVALAALGGVVAAVVAARRIIVTPVDALMRSGPPAPGSRTGLLIADAAAVTIAVAGLVELEAGGVLESGRTNPLSVLAPTLLAIAAAVIVLRLLPLLLRQLVRWTHDSGRLALFLSARQLLRRPAEARALLLVAVAVSIAVFAVNTWAVSSHDRSLRALNETGADTVLIVKPGAGVADLRTAVDRADPGGHSMAVARTSYARLPPLIAVDTARFAGVGAWVPNNASVALPVLLRRIADPVMPVTVTGTQLRLRIDLIRHPGQPVRLAVTFAEPNHTQLTRTVGPVVPGGGSYEIALPAACASGCDITALDPTANTFTQVGTIDAVIGASVRSHGGWRPVVAFGERTRWRASGQGPMRIAGAGASLSLDTQEFSGTWPTAVAAAIPASVPAVIGSAQAAVESGSQIHDVEAVGLDRQAMFVNGVIRSITLPQVDRGGVMVDYGAALALMNHRSAPTTQYQVWLSADAPRDMATRLAREHVYVQRTIRSATYRSALDRSGPAFADSLFLLSALAAIVLAAGATAVARGLSVRRRSYELAALEAVGVSPRTLRKAMATEQGSVFGIGLFVGLVAGLVGSWIALPSTPIFVHTSTGPPLVLGLPWPLLAALTVGMIVLFTVVSITIAWAMERAATPGQLRGAQQ